MIRIAPSLNSTVPASAENVGERAIAIQSWGDVEGDRSQHHKSLPQQHPHNLSLLVSGLSREQGQFAVQELRQIDERDIRPKHRSLCNKFLSKKRSAQVG